LHQLKTVKAGGNLQAKNVYREKSHLSIRTFMAGYKRENRLLDLSLWAVKIGDTQVDKT
jgi:hypothetical protein